MVFYAGLQSNQTKVSFQVENSCKIKEQYEIQIYQIFMFLFERTKNAVTYSVL